MQRSWVPQHEVAHRYIAIRAQADETTSQSSLRSSDAGVAAEAGNPETALLQDKSEQGAGGGPGGNPLIPQLYLFGR